MGDNVTIPGRGENNNLNRDTGLAPTKRGKRWPRAVCAALLVAGMAASPGLLAAEALVAVASNFVEPARALAAAYARASGHSVRFSSGSTGALYAQISHGAPFDAFLAAGDREPAQLATAGLALAESRFIYAVGVLVVWSADPARIHGDCATLLRGGGYRRVAIANPDIAPYGTAARASLQAWGLWEGLTPRLLRAENVAQVFQYAATGNADLGFVAYAQIVGLPKDRAGSYCAVDPAVYPAIRQQAVLLRRGENNDAARQFLQFMRGAEGSAIIRGFGYRTE